MNEENVSHLQSHGQSSQERPALIAFSPIAFVVEFLAGPVTGPFGTRIEIGRFIKDSMVVVAHDGGDLPFDYKVKAFLGLGAVTEYIAEAEDLFDAAAFNFFQDGLEGRQIRVDI